MRLVSLREFRTRGSKRQIRRRPRRNHPAQRPQRPRILLVPVLEMYRPGPRVAEGHCQASLAKTGAWRRNSALSAMKRSTPKSPRPRFTSRRKKK